MLQVPAVLTFTGLPALPPLPFLPAEPAETAAPVVLVLPPLRVTVVLDTLPLDTTTVTPPAGVPGGVVTVPPMVPTPEVRLTSSPVTCSSDASDTDSVWALKPGARTSRVRLAGVGRLLSTNAP